MISRCLRRSGLRRSSTNNRLTGGVAQLTLVAATCRGVPARPIFCGLAGAERPRGWYRRVSGAFLFDTGLLGEERAPS